MIRKGKTAVFFILIIWQANNVFSQGPFIATLYFLDGTVKTGFANLVQSNTKQVIFRESQSSASQNIPASSLKTISYDNGVEKYEYDYIFLYGGMRQKRMQGPFWLKVVKRGYATLYTIDVRMSSTQHSHGATFTDFYIIREGEKAGKLISTIASLNSNSVFKTYAPKYFSDYPELAEKIKKKVYKYNDLEKVVDIYNEWIESNR